MAGIGPGQFHKPAAPDSAALCCPAGALAGSTAGDHGTDPAAVIPATASDPDAFIRETGPDPETGEQCFALDLAVENIDCAACIPHIEHALKPIPGVIQARVNLSTRRLALIWRGERSLGKTLTTRLAMLGYRAVPYSPERLREIEGRKDRDLLRAMAVSGFAAANVMLISVAVWSGAVSDMGPATRDFLHWISALIALPAVAFAGMPFYRGAYEGLKAGRMTMDLPISLAVILAAGMSLFETASGGEHAYFDASVTLLFFLNIGRYLDRRARENARSAATQMMLLGAVAAQVEEEDGTLRALPARDLKPGMIVHVAAGERVPADGVLISGETLFDTSMIDGETLPKKAGRGERIYAGTMNTGIPARIRIDAAGEDTLLAEIVRLIEKAEQGRARYVRLAERAAGYYAPAVHILAALCFGAWLMMGAGWQVALLNAIAVLIVTCPCALGLAVPAVQVVASGGLMRAGILLKASDALERIAIADTIVFDKTGTLTLGQPQLRPGSYAPEDLALAAALARESRHPLSRAIAAAAAHMELRLPHLHDIEERPGYGIRGRNDAGQEIRLGNARWCGVEESGDTPETDEDEQAGMAQIWLTRGGNAPVRFVLDNLPRADAAQTIARLKQMGYRLAILSGDRESAVARLARTLGIDDYRADQRPADKAAYLEELARNGHKVLMVGDGLNDGPALAGAFVSLSPAGGTDIARAAADAVFSGPSLQPVITIIETAKRARRLILQNFALSIAYNFIAVPLAFAGLVTPLIAAIAMSGSSLAVTLNAMRLKLFFHNRGRTAGGSSREKAFTAEKAAT